MARTPLASQLEKAAAGGETRLSRRRLLQTAGVAALGTAAAGHFASPARGAAPPTIVVVGAGLAGLTCAYRLKQAGYLAEVHEASSRIGGHEAMKSLREVVSTGADKRCRSQAR